MSSLAATDPLGSAGAPVVTPDDATQPRRDGRPRLGVSGWLASGFLVFVIACAVLAPVIAPHSPTDGTLLDSFAPPGAEHWLGADATGRDIASRLLYGARTSLLGPALIVVLALALSIPLALVAAWSRGWVSTVIERVVDIVFAIPGILLAILTVAVFGPSLRSAVAALAVAYLPFMARVVLAAASAQRRQPYIDVLTVQGVSPRRIMVVHVLRNIAPILVGQATITFAYALIDLAALSFLGLGVQAPASDWGVMVSDRDAVLQGHPGQVIVASIAIVVTVLSLLVLGARLSGEDVSTAGRARSARRRWRRTS